ncbi:prolyl oligopeptidase family serine peptidase [Vibrio sp. E150_018]
MGGLPGGEHLPSSVGTLWNRKEYQKLGSVEGQEHKANAPVLAYPMITIDWMKLSIESNLKNILREKFDAPKMISTVICHYNVGLHTSPGFLFHTTEEQSVSISDSLKFTSALDDHGVPYELLIFQREPHGIARTNTLTDD